MASCSTYACHLNLQGHHFLGVRFHQCLFAFIYQDVYSGNPQSRCLGKFISIVGDNYKHNIKIILKKSQIYLEIS
jgi:hypothetical protein